MEKIEKIEEICLSVLKKSQEPWVPLDMLIQKCKEMLGEDEIDESLIVSFLKNHSEVKTFEPFLPNTLEIKSILEEKGLKIQPIFILKKRLPDEKALFSWMYQHLENLLNMLHNLEKEAKTETKKQEISIVIHKTKNLLTRLKNLADRKNK